MTTTFPMARAVHRPERRFDRLDVVREHVVVADVLLERWEARRLERDVVHEQRPPVHRIVPPEVRAIHDPSRELSRNVCLSCGHYPGGDDEPWFQYHVLFLSRGS